MIYLFIYTTQSCLKLKITYILHVNHMSPFPRSIYMHAGSLSEKSRYFGFLTSFRKLGLIPKTLITTVTILSISAISESLNYSILNITENFKFCVNMNFIKHIRSIHQVPNVLLASGLSVLCFL